MSRIGKLPVAVPAGVEVKLDGQTLRAKGPQGELTLNVHPDMKVILDGGEVRVERPSEAQKHKALHGLTRTLVHNILEGVAKGYSKTLEIQGVGYKAEQKGNSITVSVGYSHTIDYTPAPGVTLKCPNATTIVVSGPDNPIDLLLKFEMEDAGEGLCHCTLTLEAELSMMLQSSSPLLLNSPLRWSRR